MYERETPKPSPDTQVDKARPLPEAFNELLDRLSRAAEKRRTLDEHRDD